MLFINEIDCLELMRRAWRRQKFANVFHLLVSVAEMRDKLYFFFVLLWRNALAM